MLKNKTNLKYLLTGLIGIFTQTYVCATLPIQKIDLSTGAKLFYVEARTIPMVNIGIDFPGGFAHDPKDRIGVANFTSLLMNKGSRINGVEKNEAFIADSISELGSMVAFIPGKEMSSLRIKTLSTPEVLNPLISQASDMLAFPIFSKKILEREKAIEISGLLESQTKPEYIMAKQFKKMIYRDNPLGNEQSVNSIKAVSIDDLKKFHQTYYRADQMNIMIIGDLSREQAIEIGSKLTKNLPKTGASKLIIPPLAPLPSQDVSQREIKIAHPSQQAHIQMGSTSPSRKDPDYFPLLVGNYILGGGGFVSRLMNEIREKRGLAYSVSSYFYPAKNSGYFVAGMQTKKDQSDESVKLLKETIQTFVNQGPNDDEVQAAKSNLINGFPLRIDSNSKLLDNLSAIAWYDLPLNTLDEWTNEVKKVTKDDIHKAFQKNLDMNKMVTVVVGGQ
ncbi:peptidase M16 [Polynucleobacter sp. SHI8]|uniref:M16 family metallopeptidase n=1 Tax=unclassified Polynucleobacter TaxID=2640945 RepID=UPI0024902487|nr:MULTISPECIES: pitrilysin family protein [unclassified Polynucleobacter]BDW12136.1 peptidase M16 [Polynucleobacter sp. SHI2]BDW14584.1 peptidase M16 [Polynucleobacter sp. SHI8]